MKQAKCNEAIVLSHQPQDQILTFALNVTDKIFLPQAGVVMLQSGSECQNLLLNRISHSTQHSAFFKILNIVLCIFLY